MSSNNLLRVLKELEAAILSGHFKPRERLVETDLKSLFGVSRSLIREVLKILEGKGLVRINYHRGAVVVDLAPEEVEEAYYVRNLLERAAARLALQNITPGEIQRLKKLCKELEQHLRKKTDEIIEKDTEFHRAIYKISHNRCLCEMIDALHKKIHVARYAAWINPQGIELSILEHRGMIRAIEEGDQPLLEKLISNHRTFSKKLYLGRVQGSITGASLKGRG